MHNIDTFHIDGEWSAPSQRGAVFDGEKGAFGVDVLRPQREAIVSAGAFNSPKLLIVSGIGPVAHLREIGIARVHDLPDVGQNLHDQLDIIFNKSISTTELFGRSVGGAADLRKRRFAIAAKGLEW